MADTEQNATVMAAPVHLSDAIDAAPENETDVNGNSSSICNNGAVQAGSGLKPRSDAAAEDEAGPATCDRNCVRGVKFTVSAPSARPDTTPPPHTSDAPRSPSSTPARLPSGALRQVPSLEHEARLLETVDVAVLRQMQSHLESLLQVVAHTIEARQAAQSNDDNDKDAEAASATVRVHSLLHMLPLQEQVLAAESFASRLAGESYCFSSGPELRKASRLCAVHDEDAERFITHALDELHALTEPDRLLESRDGFHRFARDRKRAMTVQWRDRYLAAIRAVVVSLHAEPTRTMTTHGDAILRLMEHEEVVRALLCMCRDRVVTVLPSFRPAARPNGVTRALALADHHDVAPHETPSPAAEVVSESAAVGEPTPTAARSPRDDDAPTTASEPRVSEAAPEPRGSPLRAHPIRATTPAAEELSARHAVPQAYPQEGRGSAVTSHGVTPVIAPLPIQRPATHTAVSVEAAVQMHLTRLAADRRGRPRSYEKVLSRPSTPMGLEGTSRGASTPRAASVRAASTPRDTAVVSNPVWQARLEKARESVAQHPLLSLSRTPREGSQGGDPNAGYATTPLTSGHYSRLLIARRPPSSAITPSRDTSRATAKEPRTLASLSQPFLEHVLTPQSRPRGRSSSRMSVASGSMGGGGGDMPDSVLARRADSPLRSSALRVRRTVL